MKTKKIASEPDSDMAEMLGLSGQEFKINTITMLKSLMEKVIGVSEQMGNVIREIKAL